jgi:hypothetical protein
VALMPIKVNAGARRQGTECPRRVRLDAGLSGGIGRVGIGSLGVLGLLARGMRFDVLFFCFFSNLRILELVLDIPTVARSLILLIVGIGMLVMSSLLDT